MIDRFGQVIQSGSVPGTAEILSGTLRLAGPARRPFDRWVVWPSAALTGGIAAWAFWLALWDRGGSKRARRSPRSEGGLKPDSQHGQPDEDERSGGT